MVTGSRSLCARLSTALMPAMLLMALTSGLATPTEARITRIVVDRTESPTFGGASFGNTGAYEKIVGRVYGEIDPAHRGNAVVTDLGLAPRNARGAVEYSADFYILKPVDLAKGSGKLLFEVEVGVLPRWPRIGCCRTSKSAEFWTGVDR